MCKYFKNLKFYSNMQKKTKLKKQKILELFSDVEAKVKKVKLLKASSSCIIAISGGQDSICLGFFLRSFQRKLDLDFDFVYCHHAWQKDNFRSVTELFQYAVYAETGYFVFLNSPLCKKQN